MIQPPGQTLVYPLSATPDGSLGFLDDMDDAIFQDIEHVIDTPRGSYALDPEFGVEPMFFENTADLHRYGYMIGQAIAYALPFLSEVKIRIISASAATQSVGLEVSFKLSRASLPRSRTFPHYKVIS